jgi:flagellar protein FliS
MKNGYQTYQSANVDTADQGKLILICYDVAIKHCRAAVDEFKDPRQVEARTLHLKRAQAAISELMGSLKLDVGDIARNLYRLYDYMLRALIDANIKNSMGKVSEVLGYLTDLREAWTIAIVNVKQARQSAVSAESVAVSG